MEDYTTGTGQRLKVHDAAVCRAMRGLAKFCVIHKRADNHMIDWPTHWRSDWGGFMEVMCPHGIGHPAAEEIREGAFSHGCDGCCMSPTMAKLSSGFRYRQGGLMRCCLKTLTQEHEQYGPDHPVDYGEGALLYCGWCSSRMIFDGTAWKWDNRRADLTGTYVIPPEAELA